MGHQGVVVLGVGVVVLREGRLLGHVVHGVELDDVADQEGVGQSVGDMVHAAELVRHGVAESEEGVGERHSRHRRRVEHVLAGVFAQRAVCIADGEVFEDETARFVGHGVAVVALHAGDSGLEGVRQGVDA